MFLLGENESEDDEISIKNILDLYRWLKTIRDEKEDKIARLK